jgi:hypothetical protein
MRVFKDGRIADKIVGEMINIESGKLHYDNGFPTNTVKPPLYPSIEHDGIITTVRSHIGIIYLPGGSKMQEFIEKQLVPLLKERDAENDYLSNYARLERKVGQFTAMKAKSTFEESEVGNRYTNSKKRLFVINTDVTDLGKTMSHNRFYWFVFPISVLVKNIESFENPRFPPTTQFVSIIHDANNQLVIKDGEKLDSNITFKHFRVCQHLISFNPLKHKLEQEIAIKEAVEEKKEEVEEVISDERQAIIDTKKCPDCQRQFKSKGGLTRHLNTKVCIKKKKQLEQQKKAAEKVKCPYCQRECVGNAGFTAHLKGCENAQDPNVVKEFQEKRQLEKFNSLTIKEKSARILELESYPEYMAQWNDVVYDETQGLALCPKRGAVFELIRYYGRWNIFKKDFDSGYVPLREVDKPIYEEDFRNIVIDNTLNPSFDTLNVLRKKQWPKTASFSSNELCSRCFTPLYGDIYVVLPHEKSLSGMGVCPTCMHYEPSIWCEDKRVADYTILRVNHPTNVEEIINRTTFNDRKKLVMKQSFSTSSLFVDSYLGDNAVYIGYEPDTHLDFQFIGWTGRIYGYINYTNSTNDFYKSGPKAQLAPIAAQAKIFPIRMIICQ